MKIWSHWPLVTREHDCLQCPCRFDIIESYFLQVLAVLTDVEHLSIDYLCLNILQTKSAVQDWPRHSVVSTEEETAYASAIRCLGEAWIVLVVNLCETVREKMVEPQSLHVFTGQPDMPRMWCLSMPRITAILSMALVPRFHPLIQLLDRENMRKNEINDRTCDTTWTSAACCLWWFQAMRFQSQKNDGSVWLERNPTHGLQLHECNMWTRGSPLPCLPLSHPSPHLTGCFQLLCFDGWFFSTRSGWPLDPHCIDM